MEMKLNHQSEATMKQGWR